MTDWITPYRAAAVCAALAVLVHLGALANGFAYDDMTLIVGEKKKIVERLARSLERLLDGAGVERIRGEGSIESERAVRVDGGDSLSVSFVLVATGSRPAAVSGTGSAALGPARR